MLKLRTAALALSRRWTLDHVGMSRGAVSHGRRPEWGVGTGHREQVGARNFLRWRSNKRRFRMVTMLGK